MQLSIQQIIDLTQGKLLEQVDTSRVATSMTWDSREVVENSLFLALVGEHVDRHDLLDDCAEKGAIAALITREISPEIQQKVSVCGMALIMVGDIQEALNKLAKGNRQLLSCPVIGVTGSSGKTTTKALVGAVLSPAFPTVITKGNRNNEIGIPATILEADSTTQMLVVEMGMRGLGQIELACSLAQPNIGVITNVGTAHMELLGSRENIALAKGELIEALPQDGIAILHAEDDYTDFICKHTQIEQRGIKLITFGLCLQANVRAEDVEYGDWGEPSFTLVMPDDSRARVDLKLQGRHALIDALAAAAVGSGVGLDVAAIAANLSQAQPQAMRQEMLQAPGGYRIINDTYNANPESMAASLELLASCRTQGRRIAVLGDMGELGENEFQRHIEVGEGIDPQYLDLLITVGFLAQGIAIGAAEAGVPSSNICSFNSKDEVLAYLRPLLVSGDIVLIKASRFMQLEEVSEGLME